jgi:DNA-binding transcriptional MerR regulator
MPDELYTLTDVARILKLKPHVINYALLTGRIPEARRVGGRRLFTLDDLANIAHIMNVQIIPELIQKGRL